MKNTGLLSIFESVMALLYLAISFMLLFTTLFDNAISSGNTRLLLGILLGVYGIFRVFRAIKKYKGNKDENVNTK